MPVNLYKVVFPVSDIEQAESFYIQLLGLSGRRIGPGEYHFDCGDVVLCCRRPVSDPAQGSLSPQQVCLAVEDLDAAFEKAKTAGCRALDQEMSTQPWGDRSFAAQDPFGNTIVFVDEGTMQREASERTSGGPNGVFIIGLVVTLQRASEGRLVASVSKIFEDELWLKLEDYPEAAPFEQGDPVQLQYYDATGSFYGDSEIVKTSPTNHRYVALSIPQEASIVQRRAAPRVRMVIPVSCTRFVSPESEEVSEDVFVAQSHDISTSGIRLETESQLTKGDKVQLALALSHDISTSGIRLETESQLTKGDKVQFI